MPAPVRSDDRRGLSRLTLLFWAGAVFAAIAAVLLLMADGNTALRFAAVLAVGSLVLIGLSITLRPDPGVEVRRLLGEVEELRAEISAVTRLGEQAAERAQEALLAVRRGPDDDLPVRAPRHQTVSGAGRARVPVPSGSGTAPREEADPEPRRTVEGDRHRGWLADSDDGQPRSTEPEGGRRRSSAAPGGRRRRAEADEDRFAGRGGSDDPPRPVGVVRHTETVHVTTRHTVVDGAAPDPGRGGGYGRWDRPVPEEQPWTGHSRQPGEQWDGPATAGADDGRAVDTEGRRRSGRRTPDRDDRPARGRAYPPDDGGADHWSDVRAGDRWASVRDDEHGRELRMGERRAAMHADGTRAELRVEDRWAAVRRPEPGRDPRGGYPRQDEVDRGGPRSALPHGGAPAPDTWLPPAASRGRQPADDEWTPQAYPDTRRRRPGPDPYADPRDDPRNPDRWR